MQGVTGHYCTAAMIASVLLFLLGASPGETAYLKDTSTSNHDIEQAAMLVTIGVDPVRIDPKPSVPLSQWNDIPDSSAYTLMHQSLLDHVDDLLRDAEEWLHAVESAPGANALIRAP